MYPLNNNIESRKRDIDADIDGILRHPGAMVVVECEFTLNTTHHTMKQHDQRILPLLKHSFVIEFDVRHKVSEEVLGVVLLVIEKHNDDGQKYRCTCDFSSFMTTYIMRGKRVCVKLQTQVAKATEFVSDMAKKRIGQVENKPQFPSPPL
ncbi:MAG: hypothetical protein BYD32DRAFT_433427 [Podila humilis]|nr:MAG: hypothetical protein BYD32DRAFT_433427 [Podila humilis]